MTIEDFVIWDIYKNGVLIARNYKMGIDTYKDYKYVLTHKQIILDGHKATEIALHYPRDGGPDALTPAQVESMDLLCSGHTYPEIACIRGVKYATVCMQLFDAFHKLGVEGQGYRQRRRDAVAKWLAKKGE